MPTTLKQRWVAMELVRFRLAVHRTAAADRGRGFPRILISNSGGPIDELRLLSILKATICTPEWVSVAWSVIVLSNTGSRCAGPCRVGMPTTTAE